ncbi:hypothetical protein KI387_027561 [Taxus chinensis]|uniref:Small acidic protein-like domain-containing protein n=1 Tax=Taxus chinensis TaxID=29808 RepID=A0AA38FXR7_TAXCH|nr:hypothetical protein KI387_027561 [Taxus chinensis]
MRDRSISPDVSQGYTSKTADSARKERRIDGERDSGRDYDRAHGRRGSDTRGTSERHSYGRNRDYHGRSDEHSYNHRHVGAMMTENTRGILRVQGGILKVLQGQNTQDGMMAMRDQAGKIGVMLTKAQGTKCLMRHQGRGKRWKKTETRMVEAGNAIKNVDRDVYIERSKNGGRHSNTDMDIGEEKPREKEGQGMMDVGIDRGRNRDENREYARNSGEHKKGHDDVKGRDKDDFGDRDESRNRTRDKYKNFEKDSDTYKDDKVQHRKRDDVWERDRYKEKHIRESDRYSKTEPKGSSSYRERDEKERDRHRDGDEGHARKGQENEHVIEKISRNARDGKHQSDLYDRDGRKHQPFRESTGQLQEKDTSIDDRKSVKNTNTVPEAKGLSEPAGSTATEAEVAHDLNAAKLAAMKAAELVNKNLGVSGCMSADQKKKLLWGNKKAAAPEEQSGSSCWEMAHFADRDRQEKFNKLMGVKGELKAEKKVEENDGGLFASEKQKELQQDLEKQFTAGLRRRDGRTVGLVCWSENLSRGQIYG